MSQLPFKPGKRTISHLSPGRSVILKLHMPFRPLPYFFGKNLEKELNVPQGLIKTCLGGSVIETWTSWEASMNNDAYVKFKGQTIDQAFGRKT